MLNMLTSLATTAIVLGKAEQIQLVAEAQTSDSETARHKLVQANVRLAHKVAKKHIRKGIDFNDLLACATEGILIAINKFDATQGASFTTYARMWMRAHPGTPLTRFHFIFIFIWPVGRRNNRCFAQSHSFKKP